MAFTPRRATVGGILRDDPSSRGEPVENGQNTTRAVRQGQRRLGSEEVARLVQAHLDGALVTELASEFGVHRSTVALILDRNGMGDRRDVLQPPDLQHAVELYEAGLSLATIAQHLGVHPSSVYHRLRKMNVTLRPRQGWPSP